MGLKDSYINDYAYSQLQGARRLAEMAGLLPKDEPMSLNQVMSELAQRQVDEYVAEQVAECASRKQL